MRLERHSQPSGLSDPDKFRTRLLVVEDEGSARRALVMLFEHAGFEVRSAIGVREATGIVAAWRPHAVLLDLMLPDGDGTDVLRYIRHHRVNSRVIVATGAGDYDLLRRARALRPDLFLVKPFEVFDVLDWLRADSIVARQNDGRLPVSSDRP